MRRALVVAALLMAREATAACTTHYESGSYPTVVVKLYYACATAAEMPAGSNVGDLGWATDTATLYAWDGAAWVSTAGAGGGAPSTATYITQTVDAGLSAEQAMGLLGTGLVFNTTATGVQSIYAGSTCGAGAKATATSAAGVLTCSAVSLTADVTGDLPLANMAQIWTDRVLGRDTAATGDVEELTVGGGIAFTGSGGLSLSNIPDSAMATSYSGTGACGANTWASTLNDAAAPTCSQPAFSNISGLLALAQLTDDASSGLCLLSGGGGDPAWTACPGGGGGLSYAQVSAAALAGF